MNSLKKVRWNSQKKYSCYDKQKSNNYLIVFTTGASNNLVLTNKYDGINAKIEWLSKWMHIFVVNVVIPAAVLPAFVATCINYFVYDLGEESYLLPSPAM